MPDELPQADRRRDLRADCTRCVGLCCVVPAFAASSDFAIDKDAGSPCPNLQLDFRCGIHAELRERGFPGCEVYDCFGAGQQVTQVMFGGRDWRREPPDAAGMFTAFPVVRELHELLWYLTEARSLAAAHPVHGAIDTALETTERLIRTDPDAIGELDVPAHRTDVDALLLRTSALVRAGAPGRQPDHRRADLIGRNLRGVDLRGANLRGAYLIGADLRGADLRMADLIGADLRGTDLRGADLSASIFLTRFQVDAARGDLGTRLPQALARPAAWSAPVGPDPSPAARPTSTTRRARRR